MGTDTEFCRSAVQIEGQTQHLARGGRTFDVLDLSKRRSGGPGRLRHPDMGTDTMCDTGRLRRPDMGTDTMSDMPIENVQRETFNAQLSTG